MLNPFKASAITALALFSLAGCSRVTSSLKEAAVAPFKPDPMSAEVLSKTHPKLKKVCDLAGGCSDVTIECHVYDNTGNTNLRNVTVWNVSVGEVIGTGFKGPKNTGEKSLNYGLDEAIDNFLASYEFQKELDKKEEFNNPVFPNSHPCDDTCGKDN